MDMRGRITTNTGREQRLRAKEKGTLYLLGRDGKRRLQKRSFKCEPQNNCFFFTCSERRQEKRKRKKKRRKRKARKK